MLLDLARLSTDESEAELSEDDELELSDSEEDFRCFCCFFLDTWDLSLFLSLRTVTFFFDTLTSSAELDDSEESDELEEEELLLRF